MIEVKNLTKYYGSFLAVNTVGFSIKKGEIVGLLGPNGAGKTTTMRMLTGFLKPSSGTIHIDGADLALDAKTIKRKIGYLPESAPLYADMMTQEYLEYVARIQGVSLETVSRTAHLCGLPEVMHKNIGELSRGYRQRVGLAHALLHDPEILVLDEPTAGLDPNQIIDVRALIKNIGQTKTVVLSTHILSEVEMICDRVIIISQGKIVADSPTSELRSRFGSKAQIRVQLGNCSFAELAAATKTLTGVSACTQAEGEEGLCAASLAIQGDADVRPLVFNLAKEKGWTLYEMSLTKDSIEDVFRTLTVGAEHDQK